VVDRGLVIWAWLLQNVIEHAGSSRGRLRALADRVDREGLVVVLIPSLHAHVATRLLALPAPLLLLLGLLGPAALRGRVVHVLALLAIENGPHHLLSGSEAGGDVEQLVGVDRRAPPKFAHEIRAGRSLEEGVHDIRLCDARELGTTQVSYEIPERLARPLGACPQVPGVPRAHVCALEVPHERAD
jgi:hypothetical protein